MYEWDPLIGIVVLPTDTESQISSLTHTHTHTHDKHTHTLRHCDRNVQQTTYRVVWRVSFVPESKLTDTRSSSTDQVLRLSKQAAVL